MSREEARSPPGQWRLLAAALPCWAATAWCIAVPGAGGTVALIAGSLGFSLLLWDASQRFSGHRKSSARITVSLLLVPCAALTLVAAQIAHAEHQRSDPSLLQAASTGTTAQFEARLTSFPEHLTTPFGERAWVRAEALVQRGPVPVLLWLNGADPAPAHWAPGTKVDVRARLERQAPEDPAAYAAQVSRITEQAEQPSDAAIGAMAARLRAGMRTEAATVPGAELVPGLSVGDTSLVPEALDSAMLESSLSHVTAVSGSNTGLAIAAALWCASRLGAGRRLRLVIAGVSLLAFVTIVGPDASVQRAAVMASVLLIGGFGGRASSALPALGLAILVLLALDPWQALQPGFGLSVTATGGILLCATPIGTWLRRRLRVPRWIALPLAVALSAQLACGPLLLLLQDGIPAIGVIANVAAAPAVPLGTGLGLLAAMLHPLSSVLSHLLLQFAALPAGWIVAVAEACASVPGGRWHWPDGPFGAVLLAACEFLLLLAWALHRGAINLPWADRTPRRLPWQQAVSAGAAIRLTSALLLSASFGTIAGVMIAAPAVEQAATPRDWVMVACDVGQGDAFLLQDPAEQQVVLVDTGDDPKALQACLARLGVGRISLLVLSHDDSDHVGALSAVIDRVDAALIAPTVRGARIEDRDIVVELTGADVPFQIGHADLTPFEPDFELPYPENGLSWQVLAPGKGHVPPETNAASLIMTVDIGPVRVLLLGDTGYEEQAALRHAMPAGTSLEADIIKVAHHGSANQDPALLAEVGAEWAMVSAGAGNSYGHPTQKTLSALAATGARVLRTDLDGTVALLLGKHGSLEPWAAHPSIGPGATAGNQVMAETHR